MPLIKRWNFCTYTLSVFSIIVRILSLAERLGVGLYGEVKFSTDRVKIQIWGKPVIFSYELCLYITRFAMTFRPAGLSRDPHGIG